MKIMSVVNNVINSQEINKSYPLDQIFPKENYKKAGKSMILHHLIAYGQPSETIKNWINKNPNVLNHHDPKFKDLTPLAVCVLMRDKESAKLLIQNGADPLIPDYKGWIPFHHLAVIQDEEMTKLLMTAKNVDQTVLSNLRNHKDGTCADVKEMLNDTISSEKNLFYYRDEKGDIVPGSQEDFKNLTNSQYFESIFTTSSGLINAWAKPEIPSSVPPKITSFLRKKFEEYLKHKPKLYLGKENGPQGLDVYVDEDIKMFQGVTIFGGELNSISTDKEYFFENINGKNIRNLGAMINDGFPNCILFPLVYHGRTYPFFVAIRDIKKGERLLWNYSLCHTVKFQNIHLELNTEELEKFIKTTPLLKTFQTICKYDFAKSSVEDCLKILFEAAKIGYLIETPNSLVYLLSKNLLPYEDLQSIVENPSLIKLTNLPEPRLEFIKTFVGDCCKVGKIADNLRRKKKNELLVKEIEKFLAHCSSSLQGQGLGDLLDLLSADLEKISSLNQWEELKKDYPSFIEFLNLLGDLFFNNNSEIESKKLGYSLKKLGQFEEYAHGKIAALKKVYPNKEKLLDAFLAD